MRGIVSAIILCLSTNAFAGPGEAALPIDEFRNPDGATSIGFNFYRSPLRSDLASIDDRSIMFDVRYPATRRITLSVGYGKRDQTWKTATNPISYSGPAYNFGIRLYLDDPYK